MGKGCGGFVKTGMGGTIAPFSAYHWIGGPACVHVCVCVLKDACPHEHNHVCVQTCSLCVCARLCVCMCVRVCMYLLACMCVFVYMLV